MTLDYDDQLGNLRAVEALVLNYAALGLSVEIVHWIAGPQVRVNLPWAVVYLPVWGMTVEEISTKLATLHHREDESHGG